MITPAFTRTIQGMTKEQLQRTYRRILSRLDRSGDTGSWDAPTLRIVHPHTYAAINAIVAHYRKTYHG